MNPRILLLPHTTQELDSRVLMPEDRVALADAMNKNFHQRIECHQELIQALSDTPCSPYRSETGSNPDTPRLSPSDTQQVASGHTLKYGSAPIPSLPPKVLTGYRFVECLANSPLVETWKVLTPNDKPQMVKLVYGLTLTD